MKNRILEISINPLLFVLVILALALVPKLLAIILVTIAVAMFLLIATGQAVGVAVVYERKSFEHITKEFEEFEKAIAEDADESQ